MNDDWKINPLIFFKKLRIYISIILYFWILSLLIIIFSCKFIIPKKYDYSVMIKVGSIQALDQQAPSTSSLLNKGKAANPMVEESIQFINYVFIENPALYEKYEIPSKIISAEPILGTENIEITVRSDSIDNAKKFSVYVLKKLYQNFAIDINKQNSLIIQRITTINESLTNSNNLLNDLKKYSNSIGYNLALFEKINSLTENISIQQQELFRLNSLLASGKSRNFSVIASRPISNFPIYPNTKLAIAIGSFLYFSLAIIFLILKSLVREENQSSNNNHSKSNLKFGVK